MAWPLSLPEMLVLLLATQDMEEMSAAAGWVQIYLAHACPEPLFLRVSNGDRATSETFL